MLMLKRTITAASISFVWVVFAQNGAPRRTACLQWDQAYNQIVVLGMAGAAIASIIVWLAVAFVFGRHAWWAASPRTRVWLAAFFSGTIAELLVVIWPRALGFGRAFFSAIDPRYLDCQTTPFGAPGLIYGLIGRDVAAFSQWPAITGLLYAAALIGGAAAWLISEAIVRSSGLETMARGGEA